MKYQTKSISYGTMDDYRSLNEISSSPEKFAKNKGNSTRYNKFNNILNENELIVIGFIILTYTWFNN